MFETSFLVSELLYRFTTRSEVNDLVGSARFFELGRETFPLPSL